ncbi:histidine--tRNA ligase, cytoplasmic, partial [Tanacetum coccineum]
EALREILEEKAKDEKAHDEKMKQKQADDEEFFLEFGVKKRVRPNESLAVFKGATQVGSIVAGGCYDNLIGMFGTKRVAAIGVGLGIERLLQASETQALVSILGELG